MRLHIGIDDTDSPKGGCTTYLGAILVEKLLKMNAAFIDYPNLIRLNPNAPWKTRGNASICLRVSIDEKKVSEAKKIILEEIKREAEFQCENTNPGIVLHGGEIPEDLKTFSDKVVQSIVTLEEAETLIDEHCLWSFGFKNRRGLIGALAAVGGCLLDDHTFELLAYRKEENRGTPRKVNEHSIIAMDYVMRKFTFNNIDPITGKTLITPHGPDPVLYGVRGETPRGVFCAHKMIVTNEPIERWLIYRSNQGTDAHLSQVYKIRQLKANHPAIVLGKVSSLPRIIKGGHVIVGLKDKTGEIDCAAYEPTGSFRNVIRGLIKEDEIIAAGGVRFTDKNRTLNLERLDVISLANDKIFVNPICPKCCHRMESLGKKKGYRCRKCAFKDRTFTKVLDEKDRRIKTGLYLPDKRAHRHLTKPNERYGREKTHQPNSMYKPWHWP